MMTAMRIYPNKQLGLSLIELLISLLIGSFIMLGSTQVVMSIYTSKRLLSAEAELQESARFGMSLISSILQNAGSFGCSSAQNIDVNSLVKLGGSTFNPEQVIEGWEASGTHYGETYNAFVTPTVDDSESGRWTSSTGIPPGLGSTAVPFSDLVKVWYRKNGTASLTSISGGVLDFSAINVAKGDVMIINDCKSVTFAQVCTCDATAGTACIKADVSEASCNTPGNKSHSFNTLNIPTTEVGVLEQAFLFVGTVNNGQQNIPTLFIARLGDDATLGEPEEVLSYVESLQILFGEDMTGDNSPNYYVSGDTVANWNNVVSVKVNLLMRSKSNNILPTAQNLIFNGATIKVSESDRHLRRVFSSTISLRNRNIAY